MPEMNVDDGRAGERPLVGDVRQQAIPTGSLVEPTEQVRHILTESATVRYAVAEAARSKRRDLAAHED